MGLYERLLHQESPRIPVHTFMAAVGDWERGQLTNQQVVDLFALTAGEQTEALALLAQIVPPREVVTFGAVPTGLTLTNVGASYDAIANSQNMGFALIQTAGITQIIFAVRVNKVGTGTQSWQLWSTDTDGVSNGVEAAVIDDAGGAGLKYLNVTKNFGSPLGAGMKVIRVRAKSTTAADDPVYFGATVSLRRLAVLTAVELHEVLLIGEQDGSPYSTVAALKARLGV